MKSTSPRLPDSPLFLDEGLGTMVVADALRAAGAEVILHGDRFARGTPDSEWLEMAGASGWIVLGKDRRIRRREVEKHAVIAAQVRLFTLVSAHMSGAEMAQAFVAALPRIARIVEANPGALIGVVYRDGKVKRLK